METKELYRTDDGGRQWRIVSKAMVAGGPTPPPELQGLSAAGYGGSIFFVDATRGWYAINRNGIMATDDGGRTWVDRTSPQLADQFFVALVFTSPSHGYVLLPYNDKFEPVPALYETVDGAASWRLIARAPFLTPISSKTPLPVTTSPSRN